MSVSSPQLALNISLRDGVSFENFYPAQTSIEIIALLKQLQIKPTFQSYWLWGAQGCGRSHLLQACVQHAGHAGLGALYLPCHDMLSMDPESLLQGLDDFPLIAFDDVDALAGNKVWELALFEFYNRMVDKNQILLFSAQSTVADVGFSLPDLASRLAWGPCYHLHRLSDEEKLAALQLRARTRGMAMAEDVAKYIMSRSSRDFAQLMTVLDTLDSATIEAQRKLTVPFVRSVCGW